MIEIAERDPMCGECSLGEEAQFDEASAVERVGLVEEQVAERRELE